MRIAVFDDERELARLSGLIEEYQSSRGVSFECCFFRSETDFLCDLEEGSFDLVFVGAALLGAGGIEAVQKLRESEQNVRCIVLSSDQDSAVENDPMEAYDYLIKPVETGSFFHLIDRVQRELAAKENQGVVLRDRRGVVWISFMEIEYVEVINKTVFFHLVAGGTREVSAALAKVEAMLLHRLEFIKTHRSYLVNLYHVRDVAANHIVTKSEHTIPISRKRRKQVQDAYMRFLLRKGNSRTVDVLETGAGVQKQTEGSWRILLVDDDPADRGYWANILCSRGCIVYVAENSEEAMTLVENQPCDCVLLDVVIPGEDSFTLCKRLQERAHLPVIFLSCYTDTDKQMEGFSAGGIDYITKDTPAELFWMKVETRIRLAVSERTQLCFGPLLLDLSAHRAIVYEQELLLSPMEFDLLWQLAEHAGKIFTPEEIFGMVCGSQAGDGEQTMQVHMSRLRRKLEKACGEHCFIETVWGQGYRFIPPDH